MVGLGGSGIYSTTIERSLKQAEEAIRPQFFTLSLIGRVVTVPSGEERA